jgi:hypothetical protein
MDPTPLQIVKPNDSLSLDDFMSKEAPSITRLGSLKTPAPRKFTPIEDKPSVCDALVLFVQVSTCLCGQITIYPSYLGLRRKVKNGYSYIIYDDAMAAVAASLPRYEIVTESSTHFCQQCFQGGIIPDDAPREFHAVSRLHPEDDFSIFAKQMEIIRAEETNEPKFPDPS